MPQSRVLSLWFPRLGAERLMRRARGLWDMPLAVVAEAQNMQVLSSLNGQALQAGLKVGQPVRDAHAMCPGLITRAQDSEGEAAFLTVLRRWAGKFSPWVAEHPPDGLVIDLTGCAHLFGGETALLQVVQDDCADLGMHVRCGLADTLGAAWALARYAGQTSGSHRNGDAIDQEARATRSRAGKRRHWTKGGAAPVGTPDTLSGDGCIAPAGQNYSALSPLPVAALRLDGDTAAQLSRLGLRRIGDLLGQPRAGLARRFGRGLVLRLDQAMGSAPEPISPARAPDHFAVRMTLPDPIGLLDDLMAGLDRLLPRLCDQLKAKERGARVVRLQAFRADQGVQSVEVALARASSSPDRIRPLLAMKLDRIEAGFGIDMLRIEALQTEALHNRTAVGHLEAGRAVNARLAANTALDDLIGRIGARVGLDVITRLHPAASHVPEKTQKIMAAAWSTADTNWPDQGPRRPVLMWRPEPVRAPDQPAVPAAFRWRGRTLHLACATGPERIAPEWWLDDPDWRSGVRDYWVVTTRNGERLWLFYGHGGTMSAGWFCQGSFA